MASVAPTFGVVLAAAAIVAAAVATLLAALAWRRRPQPGAATFAAMTAASAAWVAAYALLVASTDPAVVRLLYFGIALVQPYIALLWLVFAHQYAGRADRLTRPRVAALAVPLAVDSAVMLFRPAGLARATFEVVPAGGIWLAAPDLHPFGQLVGLYSYLLVLAGFAVLFRLLVTSAEFHRHQISLVVVGALLPTATSVAFVAGVGPVPGLDTTPYAVAVQSALLFYALFGVRLFDVTPVARAALLETIDSAVIVVDGQGRVVDANPVARRLAATDGSPVARSFEAAFPAVAASRADDDVVTVAVGGEERHFARRESSFAAPVGGQGRVFVLTDVTERREYERELEHQIERLETFAGVLSHDLRNPLNVARGRVELLCETYDDDQLETVAEAHDRMTRIVEDVLTLVREGQPVGEAEPVDLGTVAEAAWGMVETGDARLAVASTAEIVAAEARLQRAFENLFRNAVEHATPAVPEPSAPGNSVEHDASNPGGGPAAGSSDGPTVTVRVGLLRDGGFYVEDDGPGIPLDLRDAVFEPGTTTAEDGTGFGLSIVDEVAEAHGWEVRPAEGTDGGARFEFTGVDLATETTGARAKDAPLG